MESEKAKSDRIARQREYYLKHRDKMLAYSRKYIKDQIIPKSRSYIGKMRPRNEPTALDIIRDTISATKKNCWKSLRAGDRITPKR